MLTMTGAQNFIEYTPTSPAPSKASERRPMRTIKLTTGAEVPLDGDLMTVIESLYLEITAKRELERTFEDTVKEIQEIIDQMTDDERRHFFREPVPQFRLLREPEARRADEEAPEGRLTLYPSVPELPGHPVHVQLAVEHDGAALRWPPCVAAPTWPARARRRASGDRDGGWTGATAANLRRDLNRRLEVLRGLPAQAAAQEG